MRRGGGADRAHALSAEGVRQLLRIFYRIATTVKPDIAMLGVLPVMYNERIRHHRVVLEEIARELGSKKLLPAIRMDIHLAGKLFRAPPGQYSYAASSRGAQDYKVLADHLIENLAVRGDE